MNLPNHIEVIVVGGGHAGLCAAITAAQAGAKVLLLERAPKNMRGGNSRHTRNLRALHDKPIAGLEGQYTDDEFWQDLLRVTEGKTDKSLAQLMIRESSLLLTWLQALGVRFQPSLSGTLSLSQTNAFFLGGGCALMNSLYLIAADLGVQICYDCDVRQVAINDHRCESITIQHGGEHKPITADAVVVASGGFQANRQWMTEIWGAAAQNFLIRGTPYNEGHVLQALIAQGAATVGAADQCHAVAIDARAPKFDGGIVSRLDCVPFSVVVNQHAERFYDEGEDFWPKRYAIWGRLVAAQPNQIAYAIVDGKVIDKFMPSLFPPIIADSLESLAKQLDLPNKKLNHTIASYNAATCPGTYDPTRLDDCATKSLDPNKSHWALQIDQPPFYAFPLRPGITFTYLGVKVDEYARVQMSDQRPVTNLYAAGEIMAGNILGQGYCAGTGMTIGGVFGRIAGAQAACQE